MSYWDVQDSTEIYTGVLDEYLGVHDVTGLKFAGLSIVPENVSANTTNTTLSDNPDTVTSLFTASW